MASCSQVSQNKRGRNEYWNGGFASPDAKRTIDSDVISLLDKIDTMDNNESKPEGIDAVNELDGEIGFNDEVGLNAQAHNNIESSDEKASNDQTGSIKEGDLIELKSEATSSMRDARDFKKHDDVGAELGFLADSISPDEFGIIVNYIDGESMTNITNYSDAVYGYAEIAQYLYGSLWVDDIGNRMNMRSFEMISHRANQNNSELLKLITFGTIFEQCRV